MTTTDFYEYAQRTIARLRNQPFNPAEPDPTLLMRISIKEASTVLGRSVARTYHYVSDGYLKRSNGRLGKFAEFSGGELVRCAELIHIIDDPNLKRPTPQEEYVVRGRTRTTRRDYAY